MENDLRFLSGIFLACGTSWMESDKMDIMLALYAISGLLLAGEHRFHHEISGVVTEWTQDRDPISGENYARLLRELEQAGRTQG